MRKLRAKTRALDAPCCAELGKLDEQENGPRASLSDVEGIHADERRLRMKEAALDREALRKPHAKTRAFDAPCCAALGELVESEFG